MYHGGVLNGEINRILGNLRHTDRICIADCGLPLPEGVEVVDLCVRLGQPSFLDVLKEITEHFDAEKIVLADEISPDTCRLWDEKTHEKLDKDRFRRDLGGAEEAYEEVMRRLMGE